MNGAEVITPEVGDVAMFWYEKSGLPHIAVVEYVFDNGGVWVSEANMYHLYENGMGIRYLEPDYVHLIGFYSLHERREAHQAREQLSKGTDTPS